MPTLLLIAVGALALAGPAQAQDLPAGALVLGASLSGGVEAGRSSGPAGLFELELGAGWDLPASAAATPLTIRPELSATLGTAPDRHAALRPGVRLSVPETPLWLRTALDLSNARGRAYGWRWLLVGVAWELRVTAALGLTFEVDTGFPLSRDAGLPLMVRGGATFRP